LQVGGTKCTSLQALQRFFDRLTDHQATAPTPLLAHRRRAIRDAEAILDAAGI
jgi:hypothetical protein